MDVEETEEDDRDCNKGNRVREEDNDSRGLASEEDGGGLTREEDEEEDRQSRKEDRQNLILLTRRYVNTTNY